MHNEPNLSQQKEEKNEKEVGFATTAHYFIEILVLTLCVVLFLTVFVTRHTIVAGSSMQDTLQDGQHLLISDLFYEPQRGDIVVIQSPDTGLNTPIVKRIIALEGDRIKIENGTVFINGEAINEDAYVQRGCHAGEILNFPEITISKGHIFVMGDHRDKSYDSREFGEIDARCIIGKVYACIFPFDQFGFPD